MTKILKLLKGNTQMFAIAPALVAIAFLVDPLPGGSSESTASIFVLVAVVIWFVEALWRTCRALFD